MVTPDRNMDQIPHHYEDAPPCPVCGAGYEACEHFIPEGTPEIATACLRCSSGHLLLVHWTSGRFHAITTMRDI